MSETISGHHNTPQILNPGTPDVTITGIIKAHASVSSGNPSYPHLYAAVYAPSIGNFTITNLGVVYETFSTTTDQTAAGIFLGAPGILNNQGTIYGYSDGVLAIGGTVNNKGLITGYYEGVRLAAPCLVNNASSGIISSVNGYAIQAEATATVLNAGTLNGYNGIYLKSGGSVTNSGSIDVTGAGINLADGGFVANTSVGSIIETGSYGAIGARGNAATATTVENAGLIAGYSYGVALRSGGLLQNSGVIQVTGSESTPGFYVGVLVGGKGTTGTLINSGTITGPNGIEAYGYVKNSGYIKATGTYGGTLALGKADC